jgi:hypothetical protein
MAIAQAEQSDTQRGPAPIFIDGVPVSIDVRYWRSRKALKAEDLGFMAEAVHLRLRHLLLLVVLTPPVGGHAPRLVHIERRDHEQHQQASTGVEEIASKPAELGAVRLSRHLCQGAHGRHVQQQDYGGKDGQHQCDQDPIVPEQAPRGAQ